MKIDKQEVEHIALLARLALTEVEKEQFAHQLTDILAYAEQVGELNTETVEPAAHPYEQFSVMRPDKVEKCLRRQDALANAPAVEAGAFKVPKII